MTKILCVDDDPSLLRGLRRSLSADFDLDVAESARAGLALFESSGPYGVVLSDMRMPEMNGIEFLEEVRRSWPDTVRMVLTGQTDRDTASNAVNRGQIFRFLGKPSSKEELVDAIRAGLEQHRLITAERELLENTLKGAVRALTETVALSDPDSTRRSLAVKELGREVARLLHETSFWELEMAAMLSQVGRVTLPPEILEKLAADKPLTPAEAKVADRVPEVSYRLVGHLPRLEGVADMVRYQRASYDGSGSPPSWPRGDDLPLGARILRAVADLVAEEARGKKRPECIEAMKATGTYDPRVLEGLERIAAKSEPDRPPVEIAFGDLRPGHVLAAPLETCDGRRVIGAGHVVTAVLLEKLRNYGSTAGIREPIQIRSSDEDKGRSVA